MSERMVGSEDYLFNLQLLLTAQHVRVLDVPLYGYVMRQGSLTQTYKPDLFQRYAMLYRQLRAYAKMHAKDDCGAFIDRFFLWHLVVGTCMTQEYLTPGRAMPEARRKVRGMLAATEVRQALHGADTTGLSMQKKLQLMAMCCRFEGLFYYLFVRKPSGKGEVRAQKDGIS